MKSKDYEWYMKIALEEAEKAFSMGEVPVGALLVNDQGDIISKGHNLKEKVSNPVGHAEIIALLDAGKNKKSWRLTDCTLFVTLEPCLMCMGALIQSRVKQLVFGAYDKKGGALSLGYSFHNNKDLNHNFPVVGGVLHFECSKILSDFFKLRRKGHNYKPGVIS